MLSANWLTTAAGALALFLAVVIVVLIALTIWLGVRVRRAERHYQALVTGTDGGNLEAVLQEHVRQVREATGRVAELDELSRRLEADGRHHFQRVGFARYNPFRDTGGDQSFVIALADAEGNGFVISSLHGRDVTRVYGKPLLGWESAYHLTDEELQAIAKAKADSRL